MNYTIQTVKYILKNLFYIIPFAFIPAVFFAFSIIFSHQRRKMEDKYGSKRINFGGARRK